MLRRLDPTHLDHTWGSAARILEPCMDRVKGEFTLDQVKLLVRGGYMHVLTWDADNAAVVEFVNYPQFRALRVVLYSGKFTSEQQKALADWARSNGASKLELWADESVRRLFRHRDFEDAYTVMRMDL